MECESETHIGVEPLANQSDFLTNAIRYTPETESILVSTSKDQDTFKISIDIKGPAFQMNNLRRSRIDFIAANLPANGRLEVPG